MLCLNSRRRNGPEVQGRIKEIAEKYGPENVVVILGNSDPDGASIFAETVTNGDPALLVR